MDYPFQSCLSPSLFSWQHYVIAPYQIMQQADRFGMFDAVPGGMEFMMLIRVGFEVAFNSPAPTAMLLTLYLHPSRAPTVRKPEWLKIEPPVAHQRVH